MSENKHIILIITCNLIVIGILKSLNIPVLFESYYSTVFILFYSILMSSSISEMKLKKACRANNASSFIFAIIRTIFLYDKLKPYQANKDDQC